jgi:hypothetical protein
MWFVSRPSFDCFFETLKTNLTQGTDTFVHHGSSQSYNQEATFISDNHEYGGHAAIIIIIIIRMIFDYDDMHASIHSRL